MFTIKKLIVFLSCSATVILGALVFDYLYNERCHTVELYTVTTEDFRNKMEFSADLFRRGELYLMKGAVKAQDNITEGADVKVELNGETYDGYLYALKHSFDDIYEATVSVVSEQPLSGTAKATVYGTVRQNVMFVPYSCIFTDETGKDAVFVDIEGYAVKRNVELGKLNTGQGSEILSGIFASEQLVLQPANIRMGDRITE